MSDTESAGVILGLIVASAAILFMMIGYRLAIKRHFHKMKIYLRLAGLMSLMCWAVMTAVVVKYNKDYSVLRAAKALILRPETQIAGQEIDQPYTWTVNTPIGAKLQWSQENAGLQRTTSGLRFSGDSIRRGSDSLRDSVGFFDFSRRRSNDHGRSFGVLSDAKSEDIDARF